jgi:serine/threonine protein kinase
MIDTQVRVLPLAHPFFCNDGELPNRIPLYATFEAARRLLDRIEQDAEHHVTSTPAFISGTSRRLPNIHSLSRVSDSIEERMNFQIIQVLDTGLEGQRLLYLATDGDQNQIVLKFSRCYSKELHKICAEFGHAPELLAFERLPGGWFGVAMEYFPSADRILESGHLCDYGENWMKDIDKVITHLHGKGYVHGDLRPPNFIVSDGKLILVDFDWGGKDREARFPRKELHPALGAKGGTVITKEHDERVKNDTKSFIRDTMEASN